MQVCPYTEQDAARWDELVARSPMATFLHTRRFLGYHGARFHDASLLIADDKGRLVGVLPAAVDPQAARRIVSHPGSTYGGLLHAGDVVGAKMLAAMSAVARHYAAHDYEVLRYKAVPHIYQQAPAADDLYALAQLGAVRYRCDLSCAIDLAARGAVSERRRRGQKKAAKYGVQIGAGADYAAPLWAVLEENLARKYEARPVHTLAEITQLHALFPTAIEFVGARLDGELIAGVVLFESARVAHAQYIAAGVRGYEACALDAVFEYCIERARLAARRYFDFGTSNGTDGELLNADLYRFKSEFGGGGVLHEFYELELTKQQSV